MDRGEMKLLPCPFCGGSAQIYDFVGGETIKCDTCDAETAMQDIGNAAKAWNTRASAAPEEGIAPAYVDQPWRDSSWVGLSASERACYEWSEDTDLHRQCRAAYIAGATDYALSPDSRKAKPVAWRWKYYETDNWHYREERPKDATGDLVQPLYAALPPATEDEGREALEDALGWLLDAIKSEVPRATATPLLLTRFEAAEKALLAALSPSPSVGTGTQAVPSADRKCRFPNCDLVNCQCGALTSTLREAPHE